MLYNKKVLSGGGKNYEKIQFLSDQSLWGYLSIFPPLVLVVEVNYILLTFRFLVDEEDRAL